MLIFLDVAEARSFTAAAMRMGKTPSAVSQAVARLERELDCLLFYRSTRSISLTEAGSKLLSHCKALRCIQQNVQEDLQSKNPAGNLVITAPHALSTSLVIPTLTKYCEQYSEISIKLISDDMPLDLIAHQIDLAIRIGMPKITTARVVRIGLLHESLYASPNYIESRGGMPKSLSELKRWCYVANEWQGMQINFSASAGEVFSVKPRYVCNNILNVQQFVEAGVGVALLPDIAAYNAQKQGRLKRMVSISATPIYGVNQFDGRVPAKVTRFIALLKSELRQTVIA